MENTMDDYYKVLQYLRETHVDRQYPCNFNGVENFSGSCDIRLSKKYLSDHKYSIKLIDVEKADIFKILLSSPRDYTSIETFEILLYTSDVLSKDDISIGFSNIKTGVVTQTELTSIDLIEDESSIPSTGGYYLFKYQVKKYNTQMQKKNRKNSSIECININFNKEISNCYISNVIARESQFNITLEDLDELISMGKYYVMNQLYVTSYDRVPDQLKHLCFTSAAAYSFIVQWEAEGKVMDDGTREGRNYATRLFEQVDNFINKFKEANPDYNIDRMNMDLVGYSTYKDYLVHKKNHRFVWRVKP